MDYAINRYYASTQGRFTSVDPLMASARPSLPQSWNRYSYTFNNPVNFIDPDGLLTRTDDYFINQDGSIIVDRTSDSFDRFNVEDKNGGYKEVAVLEKNEAGLVEFPSIGAGFDRYGTVDRGGFDRRTGENVGQGDHFLQPETAAALFGLIEVLSSEHGFVISLGDMSSSNGSDPWQAGGFHHAGHGHSGNRSGLDIDFRYLSSIGASFQSQNATTDSRFSQGFNQTVFDTARRFGFTENYQGTRGTLRGVTRAEGHNDHGHLGLNRANLRLRYCN